MFTRLRNRVSAYFSLSLQSVTAEHATVVWPDYDGHRSSPLGGVPRTAKHYRKFPCPEPRALTAPGLRLESEARKRRDHARTPRMRGEQWTDKHLAHNREKLPLRVGLRRRGRRRGRKRCAWPIGQRLRRPARGVPSARRWRGRTAGPAGSRPGSPRRGGRRRPARRSRDRRPCCPGGR